MLIVGIVSVVVSLPILTGCTLIIWRKYKEQKEPKDPENEDDQSQNRSRVYEANAIVPVQGIRFQPELRLQSMHRSSSFISEIEDSVQENEYSVDESIVVGIAMSDNQIRQIMKA